MRWINRYEDDNSSIAELGKVIFEGSFACTENVNDYIVGSTEEEREKRKTYVTLEYMYFFMHNFNRLAFGNLGKQRGIELQKRLGILIIHPLVESLFEDQTDSQDQIMMELFERLNEAEIEYSKCNTSTELLQLIVDKISDTCGQANTPEMRGQIQDRTLAISEKMNLEDLVNAAGEEI
ncbi:hypothetical protein E3V55_02115 [Candidatus Marinimicrobia bacterium MT.SAG.3]|nr:hypothetical protein E3V55_02115 [Candidatus Marinimicrobia bacterium MT.SAG.3]